VWLITLTESIVKIWKEAKWRKYSESFLFNLKEDIFHPLTIQDIGSWNITQTFGAYVGTCFTMRFLKKVASPYEFEISPLLSQNQNLMMQIHSPGDESWLYLDTSYLEMSLITIHKVSRLKYLNIRIKDTIMIYKNTNERPCLEKPREETYFDCIKSVVVAELIRSNMLNCSTWLSNLLQNWSLPECKTQTDFVQTTEVIQEQFYSVLSRRDRSNCYMPCNITVYSAMWAPGKFF